MAPPRLQHFTQQPPSTLSDDYTLHLSPALSQSLSCVFTHLLYAAETYTTKVSDSRKVRI